MYLASLQTIDKLLPIEGADRIELACVMGWQAVVKKGEYKEGDKVVYIQIDTLIPYRSELAFLEKASGFREYGIEYGEFVKPGVKYARLKTAKFKGQVSQGLIMPLYVFAIPEDTPLESNVTEYTGVVKYEKPMAVSMCGSARGTFPSFLQKTDEERIQNISPASLCAFNGKRVYESLKIDGTSATFYYIPENDEFGVCSRNMTMLEDGGSVYALMAKRLNIKEGLKEYCLNHNVAIALQGEIAGPGIQDNPLKLKEQQFFAFTVQRIIGRTHSEYLPYQTLLDVCKVAKCNYVPILTEYRFDASIHTKQAYIEQAMAINAPADLLVGFDELEGKVIRCKYEDHEGQPPRGLARWSFKVINNNYKE